MVLRIYFGAKLSAVHRARAFLMQQLNRMFYALAFLTRAAAVSPQTRVTAADLEAVPRFGEVRGELASQSTPAGRLRAGTILLGEMRRNLESPRFAAALRVVDPAG
jgi:hypothetical protein